MLLTKQKAGNYIVINGNIIIKLIGGSQKNMLIGIDAPESIQIEIIAPDVVPVPKPAKITPRLPPKPIC